MKTKKVQVKDLKNNDKIKSYKNGEVVYRPVTNIKTSKVPHGFQIRLTFENGSSVVCSSHHPIMCFDDDYNVVKKYPHDLSKTDLVISDNKITRLVSKSDVNYDENFVDITVDDSHVFFCSEKEDQEMVLTHNTQNGLRGGAVTTFFPFFHWEIEDILQLKNNQGSEDTSVRHIDYSVGLCKIVYERYINNENITLFSNDEAKELYENFGTENFEELYKKFENKKNIRRKQINAREFVHTLMAERFETGRIYVYNADHINAHSHTDETIYMSNLCKEIVLPTKPIQHIDDEEGRVATCILSALNVGVIKPNEYEKVCDLAVRALDQLIDYQNYPIKAAELYTKEQRTLGIGVINYAYYLAKNKLSFESTEAYKATHELFEKIQYNLLKSSNELAMEKGACSSFNTSKYSRGILPIDTYKKSVDDLVKPEYNMDWESLRENIVKYGLRNNCVTAIAPTESSSLTSGATSGIDPVRNLMTIRRSKRGDLKTIVPEYQKLKNLYEPLWEMKSMKGYLSNIAVMQKFIDQSISTNTSYNPLHFENNTVTIKTLVKDLFYSYKMGIKTLYYNNCYDLNSNDEDDDDSGGCDSGACSI